MVIVLVIVTLLQHIGVIGGLRITTSITIVPTPKPSTVSSFPELSSPVYWPWPGTPLTLPVVNTLTTLYIPKDSTSPYYDTSQYVVWEMPSNQTQQYTSIAHFRDAGNDMKYGIVFFMEDINGAQQFYQSLSSSYNKMWINAGQLYQWSVNLRKYHMLQTCSDLVYRDYYLPTGPMDPKMLKSLYYVTSRSYDGSFHVTIYNTWDEAMTAYAACVDISVSTINSTIPYWDTVALYSGGQLIQKISHSRGSELEHMGVFQWLESINSYSSCYLIISYHALNGHPLNRIHRFNTSDEAYQVMNWNTWYNSIATPLHPSSSYIYYYNTTKYPGQGTFITSNTKDSNSQDDIRLKHNYEWLTRVSPAAAPDPTPYAARSPTSYPTWNPYDYPPADILSSYSWSSASITTQALVVALPIVVFTVVGVILLVTYSWMTCCHAPTTEEIQPSRVVSCLSYGIAICSIVSFCLLMISIITARFSYMTMDARRDNVWASYGPFSMTQTQPYSAWTDIHWTAEVFTITVGISMILAIICLYMTVWCIKNKHFTKPFTVIMIVASFLFTVAAIIMWIPIHIQIQDKHLIFPIALHNPIYCEWGYCATPRMGYSFILLIVASIVQLLSVIWITIIRCSSRTTHILLEDKHSLQRVDVARAPHEQYYQRVSIEPELEAEAEPEPAPEPAPVHAYVYGEDSQEHDPDPPAYAPPASAYVAPVSAKRTRVHSLSVGLPVLAVPAPALGSAPAPAPGSAPAPVITPLGPISSLFRKLTSTEGQTCEATTSAPIVHIG